MGHSVLLWGALLVSATASGQQQAAQLEQLRQKRLELFGAVCVDWYARTFEASEDQKRELARAMDDAITASQAAWKPHRRLDFGLIRFAGERPGAGEVLLYGQAWKRKPSDWHTASMRVARARAPQLEAALTERHEFQLEHITTGAIGLLHQEIGLTTRQRDALRPSLDRILRLQAQPKIVLFNNLKSFRMLDDADFRKAAGREVSRHLGERLAGAIAEGRPRELRIFVRVKVGESPESRTLAVKTQVGELMPSLQYEIASRIQSLTRVYTLSDRQVSRLNLAAKGVSTRIRGQWEDKIRTRMTEVEAAVDNAQNAAITFARIQLKPIDLQNEPIWARTVARVVREARDRDLALESTDVVMKQAMASQLLVLLDRELWLMPKQRDPLLKIIRPSIRSLFRGDKSRQMGLLMSDVVTRMPDEQLQKVLTPEQLRVIVHLRKLPIDKPGD